MNKSRMDSLLQDELAALSKNMGQATDTIARLTRELEQARQDRVLLQRSHDCYASNVEMKISHMTRELEQAQAEVARMDRTCRKVHADDKARLAAAEAVVGKWPKTADGVAIVVGMRLFWKSDNPDTMKKGVVVAELLQWEDGWGAYWYDSEEERNYGMPDDFGLYSTAEAAAQAETGAKP